MHIDPRHLAALSSVLRLGSFDSAAHDLGVTPSAISQRIKALEDRIGAVLIHRGPPCTGTKAGLRLAKHAEDINLLDATLLADLGLAKQTAPTQLRVAVNADSLATWFVEAMAACDGFLFDLVIDDQDYSADWLRRGEVSAAVTADNSVVQGCDSYALGALQYRATASPGFIDRWLPNGADPEAFSKAPSLIFNTKDGLQKNWLSHYVGRGLNPPHHFLPSTHAFVDAARLGLGWGLNPAELVDPLIKRGELQTLLPDSDVAIPLCWQVSRMLAPALTSVTKAVRKTAQRHLLQVTAAG
ncbi:LysR family transcriptional regulator ArgP [Epibacterium ulvae]|uniref:LysR family transcriptional regulator ArgP n=1 Tax=Epibacterium ulvae TaxID=1156985 RepID=UPI002491A1C3|nr:LysR family transcriptional regulator ArgP [Epibacterium ulvae]